MIFISNPDKKARKEAVETLQMAQKIYDYRRDLLPQEDRDALQGLIKRMQGLVRDKSSSAEVLRHLQK